MRGFVAVTDFDWYEFLRVQRDLEEVNFWQPCAVPARATLPDSTRSAAS